MKHIHRVLLAIAAVTAVALVIPSANAHAAPTRVTTTPFVTAGYAADRHSVVATLRDGVFSPTAAGTGLQVRDIEGRVVETMPLGGTMDGFRVPLRWSVSADRRTATFTPVVPAGYRSVLEAAATDAADKQKAKPRAKRISKQQRYDMMWKELNAGWKGNTPLYTLIGGLIGFLIWTVPGAAIGAAIGAYIGYQTSNPKAWPSIVTWWNTP
ncbi:hypothetical protein G3I13_11545 [Streptomyces sp. SID6673]|nr:hypothetical protein [Streptomyces sp. SID11726]NEB24968.1 hypothetical protein [Streptomyces sp. SID6673]